MTKRDDTDKFYEMLEEKRAKAFKLAMQEAELNRLRAIKNNIRQLNSTNKVLTTYFPLYEKPVK